MSTFAKRLKYLRTRREIPLHKLAAVLHYSVGNISKWESGEFEPSTEVIKKIADFFDVSVDYLVGATNNPSRSGEPIIMEIDLLDILSNNITPHIGGEPLTPKQLANFHSLLKAFLEIVEREKTNKE